MGQGALGNLCWIAIAQQFWLRVLAEHLRVPGRKGFCRINWMFRDYLTNPVRFNQASTSLGHFETGSLEGRNP